MKPVVAQDLEKSDLESDVRMNSLTAGVVLRHSGRKSEVRGQKSEVRSQKSEVRGQMTLIDGGLSI